ncbi:probable serine hydrolase isoform X4 [Cimex lectularius]|nr:probable serine hydrolase isoform X4 [Cimex lectularius]
MMTLNLRSLRKLAGLRNIHTTPVSRIDATKVEEVRIPVPWGHIAGKWWGDQNSQPLLTAHGLLDNAGSFDKLVPELDVESVLCLDLPGHGLSSHKARGAGMFFLDSVFVIRYIIKNHFNWDKVSLLGHSYGSSIFFTYAGCFPDGVDKMINLDCARVRNADGLDKTVQSFKKTVDEIFASTKKIPKESNGYSIEECVKRMFDLRVSLKLPLSEESCRILLKRGTINIGGKYKFSHDYLLKINSLGRNTHQFYSALTKNINCDVLNVSVSEGGLHFGQYLAEIEKQIDTLKKNGKNVIHAVIGGGHHAHLEHPELVHPIINSFLKT